MTDESNLYGLKFLKKRDYNMQGRFCNLLNKKRVGGGSITFMRVCLIGRRERDITKFRYISNNITEKSARAFKQQDCNNNIAAKRGLRNSTLNSCVNEKQKSVT